MNLREQLAANRKAAESLANLCKAAERCRVLHLQAGLPVPPMLEKMLGIEVKRGEQHHASVLTEDSVREIRERYAEGDSSHQRLADEFGVSSATISQIVHRDTWPHVR